MSLDLAAIFGAGLLTFATPCVLPLIPIYLALLLGAARPAAEGQGGGQRLVLVLRTLLFSTGMLIVFVGLGLTATSLGALLAEHRVELTLAGGLLIFLFGLKFLGVLHVPWLERDTRLDGARLQTRSGALNALVMGVVFSLGWTPCVGPILGSVLTYTASTVSSPLRGALYLAVYAAGFLLPLLVLSLFADSARSVLRRVSGWLPRIEKLSGALLVAVALFLIFTVSRPPAATASPAAPPVAAAPASSSPASEPPLGAPSTRPRMVQFTSPSCSVCRQMIPTVGLIERDCGGQRVDVVKVDVTRPEGRALASRYGVRGVPTFVFLDRKGEQAARLVGYQTLPALRQALATLTGGECRGVGLFTPDPAPSCGSSPAGTPSAGAKCGG